MQQERVRSLQRVRDRERCLSAHARLREGGKKKCRYCLMQRRSGKEREREMRKDVLLHESFNGDREGKTDEERCIAPGSVK